LPTGVFAGFLVAVAAVLVTAFLAYASLTDRSATAERTTKAYELLGRIQNVLSLVKDAETGQRGYLLTGNEAYLEPYNQARAAVPEQIAGLRGLLAGKPEQTTRIDALAAAAKEKLDEVEQTIALRRAGDLEAALAIVRTDRGRAAMNRVRSLVGEMESAGGLELAARHLEWQEAARASFLVTFGGSALLLVLIGVAAWSAWRNHRLGEEQVWLRSGQSALVERMQGDQRLDALGAKVLDFLVDFLDAQVAALYVKETPQHLRRIAAYAIDPQLREVVEAGTGLLGQAAKDNRALHVRDVPPGYLVVSSSLGSATAQEVLIVPASVDGRVQAVIELGFLRRVTALEHDFLGQVSEAVAVAIRASRDRTRLEELLEETQRQAEELQAQQEELRVSNEELEEQGRALKESQATLEAQQTELEASNSQLEAHARLLEEQKEELSRSQAALTEKAADLERASLYKSEFLANMSHELRTPLNSTLILAKLLADNKDGNLTPEQVRFAETICSAGNDLLELINDVLDLSKIEAGKADIAPERVTLVRLVDGLLKSFEPQARDKGLALRVEIAPGTPERIETDGQRLGQILRNLLSNAIKFTDRGEVSLQVSAAGPDRIAFAVHDTGIGIPEDKHELVFEAFQQGDGSTHRRYGGTGLGLSISRDLTELLGGELALQSSPGKGSVFTLTLPRVYAGAAPSSAEPRRPASMLRAAAKSAEPRPTPAPDAAPPLPAPSSGPGAIALPPGAAARPPRPARGAPRPTSCPAPAASHVPDDRGHLASAARLILVIEDDVRFAAILRDLAHELGFQCVVAHSAREGLAAATEYRPSAILLDMNLPDHSGLGVLDQLKRNPLTRHIPVHVASVADYAQQAMERGAVGYALKPVKREDLVEALKRLEAKFTQGLRRLLIVEDDPDQRGAMKQLLANARTEITTAENAVEALEHLRRTTFDCMVMDLNLPDLSGYELLEKMAEQDEVAFPPVIVYTGRALTRDEELALGRYSKSIIVKGAHSPERLLDEVTLFLHQVETELPPASQRMLKAARDRESAFDGRRILIVEDDVRNVFALSSILEPKGVKVEIARNGREALEALAHHANGAGSPIDLVLMDVMMPEMDGLTAMREIRKRAEWKKLPIIALTAKAMRDDQEKCLDAGANDYIAKPLDVDKLLSLVRVWMPA
jgi:CheY-like chemotaxis protein/CHASE3 domain sensor protein